MVWHNGVPRHCLQRGTITCRRRARQKRVIYVKFFYYLNLLGYFYYSFCPASCVAPSRPLRSCPVRADRRPGSARRGAALPLLPTARHPYCWPAPPPLDRAVRAPFPSSPRASGHSRHCPSDHCRCLRCAVEERWVELAARLLSCPCFSWNGLGNFLIYFPSPNKCMRWIQLYFLCS
jgi:hypothetical protein